MEEEKKKVNTGGRSITDSAGKELTDVKVAVVSESIKVLTTKAKKVTNMVGTFLIEAGMVSKYQPLKRNQKR